MNEQEQEQEQEQGNFVWDASKERYVLKIETPREKLRGLMVEWAMWYGCESLHQVRKEIKRELDQISHDVTSGIYERIEGARGKTFRIW